MRQGKRKSDSKPWKVEFRPSVLHRVYCLIEELNGETVQHEKWLEHNGGSLRIMGSKALGRKPQCREKTVTEKTGKVWESSEQRGGHSAPGGLPPR